MKVIYIVGTRCKPEYDEAFNKWYDETHIPMLLKFNGLTKVSRYRTIDDKDRYPRYLAVYEFPSLEAFEEYRQSRERQAALDEMKTRWTQGEWELEWQTQYRLVHESSERTGTVSGESLEAAEPGAGKTN